MDKGGGIVIQNHRQYHEEIMRQISNTDHYVRLPGDPAHTSRDKIGTLAKVGTEQGFLSTHEFDYLTTNSPRTPVLYMLPKIHKDMTNPPGRPILSGCGSILEPVGRYINTFPEALVPLQETFTKDSTHMFNLIEGTPFDPGRDLLVTLDIVSLYTNIPQEENFHIIRSVVEKRERPHRVPTQFIILTIPLRENYFRYDRSFYQQCGGTSMGAVFAPTLANIYVYDLEHKYILFTNSPYRHHIKHFRRYIDNIFMLWTADEALHLGLLWNIFTRHKRL